MVTRKVKIDILNCTDYEFKMGGEFFDVGAWEHDKPLVIPPRTSKAPGSEKLSFQNIGWFSGISGYVYFTARVPEVKHLAIAFDNPFSGDNRFQVEYGPNLEDPQVLWVNAPKIVENLRTQEFAWEVLMSDIEDVHVQIYIGDDAEMFFSDTLKEAKRLSGLLPKRISNSSEQKLILKVKNQHQGSFHLDGEILQPGSRIQSTDTIIQGGAETIIEFTGTAPAGTVWWSDLTGRYFTIVFSLPATVFSTASFNAWAGEHIQNEKDILEKVHPLPDNVGDLVNRHMYNVVWQVSEVGTYHKEITVTIIQGLKPSNGVLDCPEGSSGVPGDYTILYESRRVATAEVNNPAGSLGDAGPTTTDMPSTSPSSEQVPRPPASATAASPHLQRDNVNENQPPVRRSSQYSGGSSSSRALVVIDSASSGGGDASAAVQEIWDKSRPKNVFDGLVSGIGYTAGGVASGVGAIVAGPIIGAKQNGFAGFFGGLATGAVAGAGLAVGGVVVGVTQIGRGFVNTADQMNQGPNMVWDTTNRVWVDDTVYLKYIENLPYEEDSDSDDEGPDGEGATRSDVKEMEYYDLLDIPPTATASEIKKAYYKQARITHPDKNPDDPGAHVKFQKLSKAYQVLSDPALRAKYDAQGSDGIDQQQIPQIDPVMFFSVLFGSEKFENYTGKLFLGTQMEGVMKQLGTRNLEETTPLKELKKDLMPDGAEEKMRKRNEKRRELRCAIWLREKINIFVEQRREKEFVSDALKEAAELRECSFGPQLLACIGFAYENAADIWFAKQKNEVLPSQAQWDSTKNYLNNRYNMATGVAKSAMAVKNLSETAKNVEQEKGEKEGEDVDAEKAHAAQVKMMQDLEQNLPIFLSTLWEVSAMDLEAVLAKVTKLLLCDVSVPWQIRYRRARALKRLGRIFQDAVMGDEAETLNSNARQKLEQALLETVQKEKTKA